MTRSSTRKWAVGLIAPLLAAVALVPALVNAQDPRPPAGQTVSGEVKDVNPLTVEVNGQDYLLATDPNIVTVREGEEVKLGDLKQGDKITFTTNPDSSVNRIEVTDPVVAEDRTWLMIGLGVLALIVVAGILWFLSQRRSTGTRVDRGRTVSSH